MAMPPMLQGVIASMFAGLPDQAKMVWLAANGVREMSQSLGTQKAPSQAYPSAGELLQGNLGDIDRVMLLQRLQANGGAMGPGAMAGGAPPMMGGAPPMPGGAPMMGGGPGLPMGAPPMGAPAGPPPGPPIGPSIPSPAGAPPGGNPMAAMIMQRLLAGAGGAA